MFNCGIVSPDNFESRRTQAQARTEARSEAKRVYRECQLEEKKSTSGLTKEEKAELAAIKIIGAANDFADAFVRKPYVCY